MSDIVNLGQKLYSAWKKGHKEIIITRDEFRCLFNSPHEGNELIEKFENHRECTNPAHELNWVESQNGNKEWSYVYRNTLKVKYK